MRILHTSDWHLGRTLHGVDLLEHQAGFLDHLVELVRSEDVGAVVVSGDVYDRAVPPVEAVQLLADALTRLSERADVLGAHQLDQVVEEAGLVLQQIHPVQRATEVPVAGVQDPHGRDATRRPGDDPSGGADGHDSSAPSGGSMTVPSGGRPRSPITTPTPKPPGTLLDRRVKPLHQCLLAAGGSPSSSWRRSCSAGSTSSGTPTCGTALRNRLRDIAASSSADGRSVGRRPPDP